METRWPVDKKTVLVAKAIAGAMADKRWTHSHEPERTSYVESMWEAYISSAEAAIAALEEPRREV